jgi:hypothetical protein
LLRAMGFELANVHLGSKGAAKRVAADLKKRQKGWLHRAAVDMKKATVADWEEWRSREV